MYPNQPGQPSDPYPPQPTPPAGTPPYPQAYQQPVQPYGQPTANAPQPQAYSPQGQPGGYPSQPYGAPAPSAAPTQPAVEPFTADGTASIDYLDQIAAPQKSTRILNMPKIPLMILGIVAVLLLALVAIMAITSAQPNPTQMGNKLLRQVTSTVEITTLAEKNLKSGELVSLNSTLKSQLTGASASLTASLTTAGIKLEKASTGSKAAALEGGQEVVDKLEEARLLSTYDRAYARELSYRLSLILAQLTTVHNNTNSAQLKKQLSTTYDNLKPLKDQLDSIGSKLE